MFLLTSRCLFVSLAHAGCAASQLVGATQTCLHGFKKTPFEKAVAFFAWNKCGDISRFASAILTRGYVLCSRYVEGRVS